MGFGSRSRAPAPAPDPEVARIREENKQKQIDEDIRLTKRAEEEQAAIQRRLRGSRSLFARGQAGFPDDDDKFKDNLGVA